MLRSVLRLSFWILPFYHIFRNSTSSSSSSSSSLHSIISFETVAAVVVVVVVVVVGGVVVVVGGFWVSPAITVRVKNTIWGDVGYEQDF